MESKKEQVEKQTKQQPELEEKEKQNIVFDKDSDTMTKSTSNATAVKNKQISFILKQIDVTNYTIEAYVSTRDVDREGEVILPTAWHWDNYNGVLLDSHDYSSVEQIIGKVINLSIDDKGLLATIKYFAGQGNPRADWAWSLCVNGLASYSVGFIPKEYIPGEKDIKTIYTNVELLEISQVPVPANPFAIPLSQTTMVAKALNTFYHLEVKGVIPFKDLGTAPEDTPWDGPKEIRDADIEDLKLICAWYDSSKPDVKSSYKLPHHRASDHKAVWRGVAAAMAALLGARGGVDIPESDKKGVYEHLVRHYEQFNKEPPELKEYTDVAELISKAYNVNYLTVKFLLDAYHAFLNNYKDKAKTAVVAADNIYDVILSLKKFF